MTRVYVRDILTGQVSLSALEERTWLGRGRVEPEPPDWAFTDEPSDREEARWTPDPERRAA